MPARQDREGVRDRLLDRIYAAASGEGGWQDVLEVYAGAYGFGKFSLIYFDRVLSDAPVLCHRNFEESFVASYLEHYAAINAYNTPALFALPAQVFWGSSVVSDEALRKSPYFNEWLKPQDAAGHALGVKLHNEGDRVFLLSCNLDSGHDDETLELFALQESLFPHLKRAFEMQRRLEGLQLRSAALEHTLDQLRCAVFLIDGALAVHHANRRAEALLRSGELLRLSRSGHLQFRSQSDQTAVTGDVARIATGTTAAAPLFVRLQGALPGRVVAFVSPLALDDRERAWPPKDPWRARGCFAMFLIDLDAEPKTTEQQVAAALGLTLAEARLAVAFAQGASLGEYAERRGLSLNTVRTQMKSLMSKTGRARQSLVMRDIVNILTPTGGAKDT